jgi:hypothetical protein
MSDLGQDSVNLFGPNEWVRIRVVYSNELFNGGDKIRCAAELATLPSSTIFRLASA